MELKNVFGEVIFTVDVSTIRELVEAAIKSHANLSGAYLRDANLSHADLSDANLSRANLSHADLSGANLSDANLSYADLSDANLSRANLSRADLSYANLSHADLSDANLSRANLPAPSMALLAAWCTVSEQLCADLMEYDAWNHGDRAAFDAYSKGGPCPYTDHGEQRAANFHESAEIWRKGIGKLCSPRDLMLRLFAEKGIQR